MFDIKENDEKYSMPIMLNCKFDFKVKYIWLKDVFTEMTCKKSLISNIIHGVEDIQNYLTTVL